MGSYGLGERMLIYQCIDFERYDYAPVLSTKTPASGATAGSVAGAIRALQHDILRQQDAECQFMLNVPGTGQPLLMLHWTPGQPASSVLI
jgi:hypothetical protein